MWSVRPVLGDHLLPIVKVSVQLKDLLHLRDVSAVRPELRRPRSEVAGGVEREGDDVAPVWRDVSGGDESAVTVGKTDRLPAIRVIDVIGIVHGLIACVVR